MPLAPGTRLGAYEIQSAIGAGGMGEVYRATDTNLKRAVAIKVLPPSVSGDPDRLARFQREAEVLAALNHPNIAAIYGVEKSSGTTALVMELVDGPTLADRIAQGPISLDEALPIARQIAEALEAAHERGIIHRDLKPANIKVRDDGTVKVLDFGLAKALEPASAAGPDLTNSPTITTPAMTQMGVILGTAAYMSPEQAKGRPADRRSDVWAFGCVLFEMLTGGRAFPGDDVSETLAAVIKSDPAWNALPADAPAALERLLRRCLQKDPRRRLDSAAAVRLDIDDILGGHDDDRRQSPSSTASRATAIAWIAVALAVAAILGAGIVMWRERAVGAQPVVRLAITTPDGSPIGDLSGNADIAIAPDGTRVVYVVQAPGGVATRLFMRSLGQLEPSTLVAAGIPTAPFFSPDGAWVGYFDIDAATPVLKKVASNGGPPVTICTMGGRQARGAAWGRDGHIYFALIGPSGGVFRVADGGGTPELLLKPDATKHVSSVVTPEPLPDGKTLLFGIVNLTGATNANQIDVAGIGLLDLNTRETTVLLEGGGNPHYAGSGHIVYATSGGLRAVAYDVGTRTMHGNPVPVLEKLVVKAATGTASFSLSANGTLAYRSGAAAVFTQLRTLVWVDRSGHEEPLGVPTRAYTYPHLSPDETKIALDIRDQENDIWTWDLVRHGPLTRFTFDPGLNRGGVWSPDGKYLAFSADRDGSSEIYWQRADGTGTPERLTNGSSGWPQTFTPDGKNLLFDQPTGVPFDVAILNLADRHFEFLLHGPQSEGNESLSPDGKWLAYDSDESGRTEVFVRPFPNVDSGRWQVSTSGGSRPLWSHDGRELFYVVGPGITNGTSAKIISVPVRLGEAPTFGTPAPVVDGPYLSPQAGRAYDVTADGKRFLVIKDATPPSSSAVPTPPSQIVVVTNWFDELKAKVPTK